MNNEIVTVIGKDKVGIIAKVWNFLSDAQINILDISQTIVNGYFNMMMIVDLENSTKKFDEIYDGLEKLGEEIGVIIKIQHESIFDNMHRI